MMLIPAIDLKDGRCVRLVQGRMDDETVYSQDPLGQAQRWISAGAKRLHIVDLDGAVSGTPAHAETIGEIVRTWPQISIQIGGGIRTIESALAYLDAGADYVIIGTRAVREPSFVEHLNQLRPGKVIAGLDAIGGRVAVDGWTGSHGLDIIDLARTLQACGACAVIYTDISRDGMLSGVNMDAAVRLAREIQIPVIVAGGVQGIEDVRQAMAHRDSGIEGVIAGKALYEGTLSMAEALQYIDAN